MLDCHMRNNNEIMQSFGDVMWCHRKEKDKKRGGGGQSRRTVSFTSERVCWNECHHCDGAGSHLQYHHFDSVSDRTECGDSHILMMVGGVTGGAC